MTLRAPAKLNLCLYLGPRRADGLHELLSLFCPLTLADRIVVAEAARDEVVCDGVSGANLAGTALEALRERGWRSPPLRVEIEKRIPVAAGLVGGSADAAAVLRLAAGEVEGLGDIAGGLGADVPSQVDPAFALVAGAGGVVERLANPRHFGVVLVPAAEGLATTEVYAEADRLELGRTEQELERIRAELRAAAGGGASPLAYSALLTNDLGRATLSLRPELAGALGALEEAGAAVAFVAGSGPTVAGLFEDIAAADRAAGGLPPHYAGAIVAAPYPSR
jgi:4-diphosphocytidyl-2-C-methyl-D-erythritol kinase